MIFYHVGCIWLYISVALNYQHKDKETMLNDAKFSDNGGCGYILKPDFLREPNPKYSPISSSTSTFLHPKKLKITIISGQCMPGSSSNGENNVIRPYVRVKIFGHPMEYEDLDQKYHTNIVENDSFNPFWNAEYHLSQNA